MFVAAYTLCTTFFSVRTGSNSRNEGMCCRAANLDKTGNLVHDMSTLSLLSQEYLSAYREELNVGIYIVCISTQH